MLLETLETRRLFSVTVTEGYPGFYEIQGSENSDVIEATVSMAEETMTIDGTTYTGVAYVYVHTYGGDDTVTLQSLDGPGSIGASVSSGNGNDEVTLNFDGGVWAGDGNDVLSLTDAFRGEASGSAGNDQIFISGYCVDAAISGGDGNDFIDCSGNLTGVIVAGGVGNDTIQGSANGDQLYGGAGNDLFIGGGGFDEYFEGEDVT